MTVHQKILLFLLLLIVVGFFVFKTSYAFFAGGVSNTNNSFTAAADFGNATPTITVSPTTAVTPTVSSSPTITPTPTGTQNLHMVINEVSPNGGNTADWIELFNPTNNAIDVSNWTITDASSSDLLPSGSIIPAGGFGVIIGSTSTVVVPNTAVKIQLNNPTIGNGLAAASDSATLKNASNNIVDAMSYGNDTSIFTIPAPNANQTLARHPNGIDTDSASDWIDTTASLGVTNP